MANPKLKLPYQLLKITAWCEIDIKGGRKALKDTLQFHTRIMACIPKQSSAEAGD